MKKINILVCPSDTFGVFLHRSKNPHITLEELYNDEFRIIHGPVDQNLKFVDVLKDLTDYVKKYDRLLCGGIWCILQLEYEFIEEDKKKTGSL